jgi:phosphatidate cytidylyltransferase
MNKLIVGLILFTLFYLSITFDFFNIICIIICILGLYELIKNLFSSKIKILLLIACFIIIINTHFINSNILSSKDIINITILIIISDIFQEYTGKYLGKNKIGWISPNKTYEGYIGGYIGILCYYFLINSNFIYLNLIYLLGIFGDLFFSYIKRLLAIKDYSNILSSHGGILDRCDAIIIAVFGFGLYKKCYKIK